MKLLNNVALDRKSASCFTFERWANGSLTELGIFNKFYSIKENVYLIRKFAIGYIEGEKLWVRPKKKTFAVMFFKNKHFWTHLTEKEFNNVFKVI